MQTACQRPMQLSAAFTELKEKISLRIELEELLACHMLLS